jgi:drug/metabolite transporter (DMT)-like permease
LTYPTKRPFISPKLAISLGILAASTASIFIRFAQADGVSSLVIAAWRLSLASLILAPLALLRYGAELRALTRRDLTLALLSGIFLAIHFATWITSLEYTSVASSVVLVSTAPLWVAILAPITIREQVKRPVLIGMGLALVGVTIVGISDSCTLRLNSGQALQMNSGQAFNGFTSLACPPLSEFVGGTAFIGDLLALVGALTVAGYLLIGRSLREDMSLVPYIFVVYGMAALVLIIIMLATGESPFGYQPQAYLWFLLLALIPQLLGHTSYNWALAYLPASFVSVTLLGEPISSAILAYFILGEGPTALMIFGAILILIGIYIASRQEGEK